MDESGTSDLADAIEAIPAVPGGALTAADAALVQNIPPQPQSPQEEKEIIKGLEAKANDIGIKMGQTWYILSSRWWKQWKDYVSFDWYNSSESRPKPPPIDNENIIENGDAPGEERLRKTAMENYDFQILSQEAWNYLHHWYGGGPALPRKVINSGWHSTNLAVETRPLFLKVFKSSAPTDVVFASFSKTDTIGDFKKVMSAKLGLNEEDVRVWDFHGNSKYKLLEDMNAKMESAQIIDGQPMLLEEKGADGKFPEIPKSRTSIGSGYSGSSYYSHSAPTDPGTTGLVNLGNTCFMNSSLQCLSNTPPLVEYFISDKYKAEINADNPLGMKGEIAEEYGNLVKELWAGTHSAIAPRELKWKIERFAPQFAGYQQHDSQELLAFLLDGLHEDLNRVRTKPYVENPEVDGRPEEVVAKEAWDRHKSRNDSTIVDYFQGQLKSTLVCPVCSKVSITFDPFMHLSLPLPMKNTRAIKATVYFLDPSRTPLKLSCDVVKYGSVKDLRAVLSTMTGIPASCIIIADVYNSRFFKLFQDSDSVDSIQDRDVICAYEIVDPQEKDVAHFPVMHQKEERSSSQYSYSSSSSRKLFGHPFILSVRDSENLTYKKLYDLVYHQIQRFVKGGPKGRVVRTTDELHEEKPEPIQEDHNAASGKEGEEENSSSDEDNIVYKKKKKTNALFVIRAVDNYGTGDQEVLHDNDKPLKLDHRQNLAIFWPDTSYYEDALEKDAEVHASLQQPEERELEDSIRLDKCIELFTSTEKLGPDDPWYCSRCKEFQQATKKFDLWKLPPVLVVHLKRFSYKNRYSREKLETFVDYPLHDLDLSTVVQGPKEVPLVYDLYAVSNHYGSLGGGHYVAHAKNKNDKKWYKFDDSNVSKSEEARVKSSSAYVLFYIRKDLNTPGTASTPVAAAVDENKDSKQEADSDAMEQDSGNSNSDGMEEVPVH